MFSSIQNAKRKVITFDDDGEQVPLHIAVPAKPAAAVVVEALTSKKHNNDTHTSTADGAQDETASSASSTTVVSSSAGSSNSEGTGQHLSKKQRRQLQHQNESRPKKLINKEPTTEAMIQRAKDLKKHRQSLPIFTGKHRLLV